MQVLWRESGDYFAGTVQRIAETPNGHVMYDVLYEERVRGKLVTENNVTSDRIRGGKSITVGNGIIDRIFNVVTLPHPVITETHS